MYGTFSGNDMAVDVEGPLGYFRIDVGDLSRPFPFVAVGTYPGRVTGRLKDNPAPEGCMACFCCNCDRINAEVYF